MTKRILVTGACGSIGSALVERLLLGGHIVCALDQSEDGLFKLDQKFRDKTKKLRLFLGDVRDRDRLDLAMEGVHTVFHCAALKHVYLSQGVDLCIDVSEQMVGGEIFVKNMGSCDILSLAKAVAKGTVFETKEIGLKPGEKLYEELLTDSEAPRTVIDGSTYIVLTEMYDDLSETLQNEYSKYDHLPRLSSPLRSDENLLSQAEVELMLQESGCLS